MLDGYPSALAARDLPPLIIDSFAGGGGASTGIEAALGRSPDVAIDHSAAALALHAANHPDTLHLDSNIWDVDPREIARGRKVGLLWASPDCKHFSKAKGGAVRDRNIRDLAWVVVRWAEEVKPDVILMENVEEFQTWGPLGEDGQPIKEFAGITFADWISRLKRAGYKVQHREMRACDYGAPTIRKRWFLIARRDGRRIVWPRPTHGDPKSPAVRRGRLKPWRTAAECIDWSLPCPSIFATAPEIMDLHGLHAVRPLKPNTLARVARGLHRYVLGAARPYLVSLKGSDRRDRSVDAPHPTVLAGGGHSAVVIPSIVGCGGRAGQSRPRGGDEPFATVTAKADACVVAASITRFNGGATGADLRDPMPTVTANSWIKKPGGAAPLGLIAPYLATYYGHGGNRGVRGADLTDPLRTVTVENRHAMVAPVLTYAQQGGGNRPVSAPHHTICASPKDQNSLIAATMVQVGYGERPGQAPRALDLEHHARARAVAQLLRDHGLWDDREFVTLTIDGAEFVIVDVGMRMLTPRELFRAQGFPDDYVIEGVWDEHDGDSTWRPFPKDVQVSCCGNSVCPPLAEALVRANCGHLAVEAEREAA